MRALGIFAKTFERANVSDAFAAIQSHGFTCIQFNMSCLGLASMPEQVSYAVLQETKTAMDRYDLRMAGLSATFNMCHPEEEARMAGLRRMGLLASSSAVLGNTLLTLCTGTRDPQNKWKYHPENSSRQAWLDMSRTMEQAIGIAETFDLQLGIEPELANVVSSPVKAKQLLTEMQSDRLKIILDPANLFEKASVPQIQYRMAAAVDLLGPHISMVHAKDRTADGQFIAPGKGVIPFDYFLEKLEQAGIGAPLVAHGFSEADVSAVAHFLKNV
ncbi:MAG: sugar phosphate isomerase/epimerase [Saprospiraceae bacterium]|nr:sugar phosphate isomerase/epimerase [Saprospiraceae bacterium]